VGLTSVELLHVLTALGLLLFSAHLVGHIFALLRQPRVVGEICGGLLLGPTVFGAVAPEAQAWVFTSDATTTTVLGAAYGLGLMLLMFASGAEMRSLLRRGDERTVALVTVTGVTLPFAAGLLAFQLIDPSALVGPAQDRTALLLVFSLAIAVTSIPVISRIFLDLGVMDSPFARIVLGVAVIEDVVVYIVLAVALGMVEAPADDALGVAALLNLDPGGVPALSSQVLTTVVFFVLMVTIGPRLFQWGCGRRWNFLVRNSCIAYQLLFLLSATVASLALGITPLFGAFLAGIAASSARGSALVEARETIKDVSIAVFVPLYFAVVGLQLDLLHHFDVGFFLLFTAFACVAKAASVLLGARLAGEGWRGSRNLAVATNARGGPGIVLASVAYAAGVVNESFYAALVMLAVVTSLIAGSWLGHVVRSGQPLRERDVVASDGGAARRAHQTDDGRPRQG
jgi:Kef-type K+ transport system membrane component KefB